MNSFYYNMIKHFCVLFLITIISCGGEDENNILNQNEESAIPNKLTYYSISMDGTTWNPFTRNACLFIAPTVSEAGTPNFNNGVNERDVGLVSGFPAGNPSPGAIWFFTNTALCQHGNTGCNSIPINSQLDVVELSVNDNSRRINIELDGRFFNNTASGSTITTPINNFTANGGLTATLYQLVSGNMTIQFSEDGEEISGSIDFRGGNFVGTGTAPYTAEFTGFRVNASATSCD